MSALGTIGQHGFTPTDNVGLVDPGDAGAIPVDQGSGTCNLVSAGAETRTLAAPDFEGQILHLYGKTVAGTITITVATAINVTGNTTIAITAVTQAITLIGIWAGTVLAWRILWNDLLSADSGTSSDVGAGLTTP